MSLTTRAHLHWRPFVLILYHVTETEDDGVDTADNHELLYVYSHLKKGRGLCIAGGVVEGNPWSSKCRDKKERQTKAAEKLMAEENIF